MSKLSIDPAAAAPTPTGAGPQLEDWAERFAAQWQADRSLTPQQFIERCPQLAGDGAALARLAYEEFCQRRSAGEDVDLEAFLNRFADCRELLQPLLSIHCFVGDMPAGLSECFSDLAESQLAPAGRRPRVDEVDWPRPGEALAGFDLLEVLGQGAFARVYLAEERALGRRRVVVKAAPRSRGEAQTLGKLRHPNVVPVYSVCREPQHGLTLICMPFLGRTTLDDVLRRVFDSQHRPTRGRQLLDALSTTDARDRLDAAGVDPLLAGASYVDAVVHLGGQLAEALDYTNSQGICHRDLKPSNILLDAAGKPMLLDFNLSHDDERRNNGIGGTPGYMPPEVLERLPGGRPRGKLQADPRSDLYSLGVILYELLSGELPFGELSSKPFERNVAQRWLSQQKLGPPPLARLNPDVEPALAALIERCLAFEIARRPATAYEVADALARLLTRRGRLRRWLWRHRRSTSAALAPVCLAAALGGYALATRPPYSARQFAAGQSAYQSGDYRAAANYAELAEGEGFDPRQAAALRADAHYQLAKQAFTQGDFPTARDHCTQAIDAGHRTWQAYLLRGRANLNLREFNLAQKDICAAGECRATPQLDAALADRYCAINKWDPAIAEYQLAIDRGFASAGLFNNLSYALARSDRREEALTWLDRAIAADKNLGNAYYQRAEIRAALAAEHGQSMPSEAIADVEAAMRLCPANHRVYLLAARIYAATAQQTGAAAQGEKAENCLLQSLRLGLNPQEASGQGTLGQLADRLRTSPAYQRAVEQGRRAVRSPLPGLVDSLAGLDFD